MLTVFELMTIDGSDGTSRGTFESPRAVAALLKISLYPMKYERLMRLNDLSDETAEAGVRVRSDRLSLIYAEALRPSKVDFWLLRP